jgi:hypothetical protein
MNDLTVLVDGPLVAGEVEIEWVATSPPISETARAEIERQWERHVAQARAQGQSLFNGAITRLIRAKEAGGGGARRVILMLGPADYKSFVVTVMRDREWFLAHAPDAMAYGLGNSVLMTQGDRALLGVRSSGTSAYAGRAHVIGGVLELLGSPELPATMEGILTHLRREMQEEASVGEADVVAAPMLLAIVRDEFLSQPELVWQWEISGDLRRIAARLDAQEHRGALILERAGIPAATCELMTPVARAAWERWRSR